MNILGTKITLRAEYTSMMESLAWKDFVKYAEGEKTMSVQKVDDKPASELNLGMVCEERGIRKGILRLIQYAERKKAGD